MRAAVLLNVGLSNPEGMRLARKLLRPFLPHDIHDYILEGICKAIDGSHVLTVTKTGGGKLAISMATCYCSKHFSLCRLPVLFEDTAPKKSCHGARISNEGASGGNGALI